MGGLHVTSLPPGLLGFTPGGSILFGGIMVPNIEEDYILLLGYSILYKGHNGITLLGSTTKKRYSGVFLC